MKKIFVIGIVIIIIFAIFIEIEYGDYYELPEEAIKHYSSDDMSFSKIIDKVWLGEEPVIFYISKTGNFCDAEFRLKNINGKIGYKIVSAGAFTDIEKIMPYKAVPKKMAAIKHTNKDYPNRVLFGVTRYKRANTIKINGNSPHFKKFNLDGMNFTFWYAIGSDELKFDKVSITSE